jgi:hypothetical protein
MSGKKAEMASSKHPNELKMGLLKSIWQKLRAV